MTINGKQYTGFVFEGKNDVTVSFSDDTTVLECAEIGDAPVIEADKTYSSLGRIIRIEIMPDNGKTVCTWAVASEVGHLQEQLAEARSELSESNSHIEAVRQAIRELGSGIPTLTKLTAFLSAVKEAIHYDGIDSDA